MGSAIRLLSLLIACLLVSLSFAQDAADREATQLYEKLFRDSSPQRMKRDYRRIFDSMGVQSRLAGSEGETKAREALISDLVRDGWKRDRVDRFEVSTPNPHDRGTLSLGAQEVGDLFPLWPNLVRTSQCDISGPLVDVGNGSLESMKGKTIQDAIVLMDANSGDRWRDAAKLGAAAVIFRGQMFDRVEGEKKWSGVPLDLPRFYSPADLDVWVGKTLRLRCDQKWLKGQSENASLILPGSDPNESEIWVTTYVDSMSAIPGLAPGGQAAAGAVATREAMRLIRDLPRKRTIRLWILGAHHMGMQGARELIDKSFGQKPPLLTLSIDLSLNSNGMGQYARGWMLNSRQETQDPMRLMARLLRDHAESLWGPMGTTNARVTLYDSVNQSDGRQWRNAIPGRFATTAEFFNMAGMNGISLVTTDDPRPYFDTPFDFAPNDAQLITLKSQASRLAAVFYRVANDTTDRSNIGRYRVPLTPKAPARLNLTGGFGTVTGNTVLYDPNQSFVPNVVVPNAMVALQIRQRTMMGVRGMWITQSDSKGAFRFPGVPPASAYVRKDQFPLRLLSYSFDAKGAIDHAPADGLFGSEDYPILFFMNTSFRSSPLVLFKSAPIELYGLTDPQDYKPFNGIRVIEAQSEGDPVSYGAQISGTEYMFGEHPDDAGMVFSLPDQAVRVLAGRDVDVRMVLMGPLYSAKDRRIGNTAERAAADMGALNRKRLNDFEKRRILAPALSRLQSQADRELEEARQAYAAKDWPAYFQKAQRSYALALRVYPALLGAANDLVNGVVFYLLLLIPFSVFVERLLFASRSLNRQVLITLSIFMGAFLLLKVLHPAFQIVPNPWMVFIAFVMGALSILVACFILGKFESGLREDRAEKIGLKEVDLRRGSVAAAAFGLGLGNLRRRPIRTALSALTLIVMTFIVLSFTSIVPDVKLNEAAVPGATPYAGLMLRNPGLEGITEESVNGLELEFGAAALRQRATYFGMDFQNETILELIAGEKRTPLRAVVGFDSAESDTLKPQETLLSGRWFKPGETEVILLPEPLAKELNSPSKVEFSGATYQVIGVFDPKKLSAIKDLDGDGVMPPDFTLSKNEQTRSQSLTAAFRSYIRLDAATCAILPVATVKNIGGDVRSIAVKLDPATAEPALKELMPRLRLNIYAGVQGPNGLQTRRFSVQNSQEASGFGWILVQTALASVFVLNAMIAGVFERKREIGIFSAIGLAPNHIALLFFAEALVLGVIGAVGGYLVAQGVAYFITTTGALPSLYLNFSSTSAVVAAGIVMGVVLLSAVFPAQMAKKIAAPALDESIAPPANDSDLWEMTLPFRVTEEEAPSLLAHLAVWFRAYQEYSIGDFVTSETTQGHELVATTAWLAPYDLGVSQKVRIASRETAAEGVFELAMEIERLTGEPRNWVNLNRTFLADVRRQCLAWRA